MFCGNCGAKLPEGTKYCENCGYELKTAQEGSDIKSEPQDGTVLFRRLPSNIAKFSNVVVRIDEKQETELKENQDVRIPVSPGLHRVDAFYVGGPVSSFSIPISSGSQVQFQLIIGEGGKPVLYQQNSTTQTATLQPAHTSSYDRDVKSVGNKKKQSWLGIVGFVLSFTLFLSPIGLVFCLLSLIIHKDRKHGLAIAGLIISFVLSAILVAAIINTSDNVPSSSTGVTDTIKTPNNEKPAFSLKTVPSKDEIASSYIIIDYRDSLRNPKAYQGDYVVLTVKLNQKLDAWGTTYFRAYTDNDGGKWYLDDEWLIYDERIDDSTKLLEDDIIVVYGYLDGTQKVTRVITSTDDEVPVIRMLYMDLLEDGDKPVAGSYTKGTNDKAATLPKKVD